MSRAQGVRAWHILYGVSMLMYLINAGMFIYFQFQYYVNPHFINSMMATLPSMYASYTSQIINNLQGGIIGIMATISIMLILVMTYMVAGAVQSQSRGVSRSMKIALAILLLVQIFLGNTGLVLGLIIGIVSIALMR